MSRLSSSSVVGLIWHTPATCLVIFLLKRLSSLFASTVDLYWVGLVPGPSHMRPGLKVRAHSGPDHERLPLPRLLRRPASNQCVIVDCLTLRLFVVQRWLGATIGIPDSAASLFFIQTWTTSAIDIGGFIGGLHPCHGDIHFTRQTIHRLLGSKRPRVHITNLLPPDLCQFWVIRHVDAGWRPCHAVR